MFQRFHEAREEKGFTLIELLVVILIIAILAAIAIPVFLRQREKGWVASTESSLKDLATAMESYATGLGNGNYEGVTQAYVEDEGFNPTDDVQIEVYTSTDFNSYCLRGDHNRLKNTAIEFITYTSDAGRPTQNLDACAAPASTLRFTIPF